MKKKPNQPLIGVWVLIAGVIPWAGCGPAHWSHPVATAWTGAPPDRASVSAAEGVPPEQVWHPVVPAVPALEPAAGVPALVSTPAPAPGPAPALVSPWRGPAAPAPAATPSAVRQTASFEPANLAKPAVLRVNTSNFAQHVLAADVPVLVDFYADWCGPCRALAPTLDQVAAENPQARVVKVNIDDSPELAARYGVTSVPRLMVFKGGQVAAQQAGAVSKTKLNSLLAM